MSKMSNWLKAGLLGAVVVVVLQMLGIIPCVGCVTCLLVYIAYGCIGALAGAIAAAIGGAAGLIIALGIATVFLPLQFLAYSMEGAGIGPSASFWEAFAAVVGSIACGTGCYALGVAIAAGLGALGAVIFAAIQPQ